MAISRVSPGQVLGVTALGASAAYFGPGMGLSLGLGALGLGVAATMNWPKQVAKGIGYPALAAAGIGAVGYGALFAGNDYNRPEDSIFAAATRASAIASLPGVGVMATGATLGGYIGRRVGSGTGPLSGRINQKVGSGKRALIGAAIGAIGGAIGTGMYVGKEMSDATPRMRGVSGRSSFSLMLGGGQQNQVNQFDYTGGFSGMGY